MTSANTVCVIAKSQNNLDLPIFNLQFPISLLYAQAPTRPLHPKGCEYPISPNGEIK
jgi:hypothetical protein